MSNGKLQVQVNAVQQDFESLLKLLGGTPDQRLRFWEILKGITTPQVVALLEADLIHLSSNVKSTTNLLKTLHNDAKQIGG
jgi:hypothetical protein